MFAHVASVERANDRGAELQRIHFTGEDLARVKVSATLGMGAETVFAMESLGRTRTGGFFGIWRDRVSERLGRRAGRIERMAQVLRPVPDLLWLVDGGFKADERALGRAGLSREEVVETAQGFARVAVSPYWRQVRGYLETVRDVRGRLAMTGGVERLLGTLHPRVRWRSNVLEIPHEREIDVHLGGRGLLLAPSLFLHDNAAAVLIGAEWTESSPILVFAAPPVTAAASAAAAFWDVTERGEQALGALVGRTRAAVLQELVESATTGELAERLNISSASISQHTSVLREAGLITSRRNRNTVQHSVTPLGTALLEYTTYQFMEAAAGE
ncbi:ArsR/SmtB family transcription factor [Lentzea sp. NPDC058450]|uniref:ArsR/SmtB family transcription factor n=1 Tax=Lentzea sp. NPDC058450 TaxID=3346505 RepID=UPI0036645F10